MPRGKVENLKPQNTRTKAEQRKVSQQGGKASGKARRLKKLMSEIYADLLADQSGIKKGQGIKKVAEEILNSTNPKGVSARVALMRELREGTEGSKIKTETVLTLNTDDEKIQQLLDDYGINKSKPKD
jgi:hypothetical protein